MSQWDQQRSHSIYTQWSTTQLLEQLKAIVYNIMQKAERGHARQSKSEGEDQYKMISFM